MKKTETELKYKEIKEKLLYDKYPECIPMTKTMYPKYFTFDKTKGNRWNEEKVREENQKISDQYSRNPNEKFKKGSEFYNDLVDYVSLFGFNVEQAEVIVGSKMVADLLDLLSKLNFVNGLASLFIGMTNEITTNSENHLTYADLQNNNNGGKYMVSLNTQRLIPEDYIYDENESSEWNRRHVYVENMVIKESNNKQREKMKASSERFESDIRSYLRGLQLTEDQAECLYLASRNLSWVFADYGLNTPSYVESGIFSNIDFYVSLLNELRSKALK